ncbi:MAG: hypothetical protein E6767_20440 [Dysgonomonas sp.]|nr:hypothetical protein [Dysgonomonas sp.]
MRNSTEMKCTILTFITITLFFSGCGQIKQNQVKTELNNKQPLSDSNQKESIEGRYRNSEETACQLLLDIIKSENGYLYKLQVKDHLYEGEVTISDDGDEKYVILEGIPWVKNIGMLNGDSDPDEIEGIPTYGLEIYWGDNEKVLQNYGNSMNYYVKLDCDEKYIKFVKDKPTHK